MYRIVGKDGQQYGPVTAEQLRGWIAENRANAQTLVQAEGSQEWKPLGSFPEFAADLKPPPASRDARRRRSRRRRPPPTRGRRTRSPPAFAASCWAGSVFISSFSATRARGWSCCWSRC